MYDALQIGPFTIQYVWIIFFLSFLATYYILDGLIRKSAIKQFMKQHYWTVVFILFISYKFSVILFQPELLGTNRWLFLTGGTKGIYLGLSFSLIFLIWNMVKERIKITHFVIAIIIMTACFLGIFTMVKFIGLSIL